MSAECMDDACYPVWEWDMLNRRKKGGSTGWCKQRQTERQEHFNITRKVVLEKYVLFAERPSIFCAGFYLQNIINKNKDAKQPCHLRTLFDFVLQPGLQ